MATASASQPGQPRRFNLRTIVLVTILSMLVWLLAESRTIRSEVIELTPSLEFTPDTGVLTRAALGTSWPDSLEVRFSGSAAGLDAAIRAFSGRLTMRVGFEVPAAPGVHEIDLREMIRASDIATDAGVTVVEVDPPTVVIQVDAVATADLPVRVRTPEGVAFEAAGSARAIPGTVRIVGPQEVVDRLEDAGAFVRLDAAAFAGMIPGRVSTLNGLRVELPEDDDRWATQIEPAQVSVSMTLRSRTAELTLSAMPVLLMVAPGEMGRWSVDLEPGSQDLVGVEVVGPSDQIERLRSGDAVPSAFVALGFDELERGISSKPAQIQGLPPGVTVKTGQAVDVRFSIVRREAPAEDE